MTVRSMKMIDGWSTTLEKLVPAHRLPFIEAFRERYLLLLPLIEKEEEKMKIGGLSEDYDPTIPARIPYPPLTNWRSLMGDQVTR
jgi:hypothetical protein